MGAVNPSPSINDNQFHDICAPSYLVKFSANIARVSVPVCDQLRKFLTSFHRISGNFISIDLKNMFFAFQVDDFQVDN